MASYRKSTLYDLSGLRLQEDANRVNPTASARIRPSQSRVRVQDARGNWTARDAGGPSQVRRHKRLTSSKGSEEPDQNEGESQEHVAQAGSSSQPTDHQSENGSASGDEGNLVASREPQSRERGEGRPSKRLRFSQGLDFLIREAEEARGNASGSSNELAMPSSEMLKIIHYFAGQYYTETGFQSNLAAQHRHNNKRKRRKGKGKAVKLDQVAGSEGETDRDPSSSEDGENSSSVESDTESTAQVKRSRRSEHFRDMYKAFDGSALLAIGLLVQEFVKETLSPTNSIGSEHPLNPIPDHEPLAANEGFKGPQRAGPRDSSLSPCNASDEETSLSDS